MDSKFSKVKVQERHPEMTLNFSGKIQGFNQWKVRKDQWKISPGKKNTEPTGVSTSF